MDVAAGRRALLLPRRVGRQTSTTPFPAAAWRAPLGVAGQIIPWNFPLRHGRVEDRPGARPCGNTVVLKPAETTPLTALLLAKIIEECELPPGVVNILTGAGRRARRSRATRMWTRSPSPAAPRSGSASSARLAGTGKRLTLELGGKAANVIFADAPIDQAVEGIIQGIFFNQGHVCCAGSRLLVEESVHPTSSSASSATAWPPSASATRSTRTPTSGPSTRRVSWRRSPRLVESGEKDGRAERFSAPCAIPGKALH